GDGLLHGRRGVLEDVEQEEDEYPRREPVQERLRRLRTGPNPAHGQSEEDGQTGDGAEQDGLPRTHLSSMSPSRAAFGPRGRAPGLLRDDPIVPNGRRSERPPVCRWAKVESGVVGAMKSPP